MLKYTGTRLVGNTFASEFGTGVIDPNTGVVTGIPTDKEKHFEGVKGFEVEADKPATKKPATTTKKPATATKKAVATPKKDEEPKEDK